MNNLQYQPSKLRSEWKLVAGTILGSTLGGIGPAAVLANVPTGGISSMHMGLPIMAGAACSSLCMMVGAIFYADRPKPSANKLSLSNAPK